MDKQNRNILAGIAVIVVVLIAFNMSQDDLQTSSIVAIETPDNVGVVGNTLITCPVDYTVKSTVGGTPDQVPVPFCQAPNPSLETFDCGDTLVNDEGTVFTIECVVVP